MEILLRFLLKIASVFVCAVPARYRRNWPLQSDDDLRGPAIVSGGLEFILGAPGALLYVSNAMGSAMGGMGLASLIFNPFLLFLGIFVEGGIRALAALGSAQILPTLPLQIIAWIHDRHDGKIAVETLGLLVVDKIERGDGNPWDLRVLSCRPKPHWNPYMTIRFEERFYQMIREEQIAGPRKFVYLLRNHPETRLVVIVYQFRLSDVLIPDLPLRLWKP